MSKLYHRNAFDETVGQTALGETVVSEMVIRKLDSEKYVSAILRIIDRHSPIQISAKCDLTKRNLAMEVDETRICVTRIGDYGIYQNIHSYSTEQLLAACRLQLI